MGDQAEPTVELNVGMQINYIANSTREYVIDTRIPRSEWNAMTQEERDKVCEECAQDEIDNQVTAWAVPVEDEVNGRNE